MEHAFGIVCGECDRWSPPGTATCPECSRSLALWAEPARAPAAVIGPGDETVPLRNGRRVAEGLPNAELEVIDGDHQLPTKNTEAAVAALERLLASSA